MAAFGCSDKLRGDCGQRRGQFHLSARPLRQQLLLWGTLAVGFNLLWRHLIRGELFLIRNKGTTGVLSRQEFCSFLLQSCAPKGTRAGQTRLSAVPHVFPARPRFCISTSDGATCLKVRQRFLSHLGSPGLAWLPPLPLQLITEVAAFFSKPQFEVGEPGSLLKGFPPPSRQPDFLNLKRGCLRSTGSRLTAGNEMYAARSIAHWELML